LTVSGLIMAAEGKAVIFYRWFFILST